MRAVLQRIWPMSSGSNDHGYRPYPVANPHSVADPNAAAERRSQEAGGMMLGAALILSVLCGCFGAWRGNSTSWALLASAAASTLLIMLGVPFVPPVWTMIDLAVVAVALTGRVKVSDVLVVALFVGAWPLYPSVERGDPDAADLINLIVAAQFLLSTPWRLVLHKVRLRRADLNAEGEFLKVRHA